MHCPGCGTAVDSADRFCPSCGAALPLLAPVVPAHMVRPAAYREPPTPRFGTRSKLALAIVTLVGVLAVIILLAGQRRPDTTASAEPRDLVGTIVVEHAFIVVGPTGCVLPAPNQSWVPGALIWVRNEANEIIATGKIIDSVLVDHGMCHLQFAIPQIPAAREYRLVVNGVRLPAITRRDFEQFGWNLQIRLNDFQEEAGRSRFAR